MKQPEKTNARAVGIAQASDTKPHMDSSHRIPSVSFQQLTASETPHPVEQAAEDFDRWCQAYDPEGNDGLLDLVDLYYEASQRPDQKEE